MKPHVKLPAGCTFRLRIERSGQTVLDVSIAAKDETDQIARAKKSIQRLLNEYTPAVPPLVSVLETEQAGVPVQEAESGVEEAAAHRRPDGHKGLLFLRCPECRSTFGAFLHEYQTEFLCRCGHQIDIDVPLARYRFTCPYCEKETWGQTNLEDPEITIRCKCGGYVDLRWAPKLREYQN